MTKDIGTVKRFISTRGYGFLTGSDGIDYFFHFSEIKDSNKTTNIGDRVEFELDEDIRGRPRAINIKVLERVSNGQHTNQE